MSSLLFYLVMGIGILRIRQSLRCKLGGPLAVIRRAVIRRAVPWCRRVRLALCTLFYPPFYLKSAKAAWNQCRALYGIATMWRMESTQGVAWHPRRRVRQAHGNKELH